MFEGVAARLSRFSYLASLLPTLIIDELGLRLELRSRQVRSYTPVESGGLLIERQEGRLTHEWFRALTAMIASTRHGQLSRPDCRGRRRR